MRPTRVLTCRYVSRTLPRMARSSRPRSSDLCADSPRSGSSGAQAVQLCAVCDHIRALHYHPLIAVDHRFQAKPGRPSAPTNVGDARFRAKPSQAGRKASR